MIGKLRSNFILVAMCSMFLVLAVIIGTLNIVNYHSMVTKADAVLNMLAENGGAFPESFFARRPDRQPLEQEAGEAENQLPGHERPWEWNGAGGMSAETPFETRFFVANVDAEGNVTDVDTGRVAALEAEDATEYALHVWKQRNTRGFYQHYRFLKVMEDEDCSIIFVDRERDLNAFWITVVTSISVSVLGLFAVYLLVLILSKRVFAPIVAGYEKQKRFITDASHELKTPLTIISANVEILELDGENDQTKSIHRQVERLTTLTEQMVTLSRMDEGGQSAVFTEFCLSDAIEETVEPYKALAETVEKNLQVEVEPLCTYKGDERLIRQMLSLLMDNAIKYASEKGTIRVGLKHKGHKYQLQVWNSVDEIEQGDQDVLFERFYRRDASRNSQTGGSGIGLSIVKSVVELHKGRIHAVSEDGKSLLFTVELFGHS